MRLTKNLAETEEGRRIYGIITYPTGQGLLLRNEAEIHFEQGNYQEAEDLFRKSYQVGIRCGNVLNAIKRLLGIAALRKECDIRPFLHDEDVRSASSLMKELEGEHWRGYLTHILEEIKNS